MQHEATSKDARTILIVDDEELLVELLRRMITRQGYSVKTAHTAPQALSIYNECENEIGLVITDLVMPEFDGKQLAEELLHTHPGVKILISTGYSAMEDIESLLVQGIKGVVYKPYQSEQLFAKINEALKD